MVTSYSHSPSSPREDPAFAEDPAEAEQSLPDDGASDSTGPVQEIRPAARRWWRPANLVLVATAILVAVGWQRVRGALPDLTQRPEFLIPLERIEVTQPPKWVPTDLVRQVVDAAHLSRDLSVLDPRTLPEVAAAFEVHPWVDHVDRVVARSPPGLRVDLAYRIPVAMIRVQGGVYPVDREGTLLPPDDFSLKDAEGFPLVSGVKSMPHGPAGTPWGDEVVLEAARLAETLTPIWKRLGLERIASPRAQSPDLGLPETAWLVQSNGSWIVWGRAPGGDHPGELSAAQKIGRLEKYHADFGGFDKPHGPYLIDIRHWREIARRPLKSSVEATRPPGRAAVLEFK
jgi:hypothetical protein